MPTQVQPDDPNATGAARLQSMVGGARTPGSPSTAGKPGVQAGRTSFPAPPAPATAPIGRPAQPTPSPGPGRAAMAQPSQPGTPAPGAAPTTAAPPQAAATPPPPGSPQPAPGAGSSQTAGTGAPAAPAPPALDAVRGSATQTLTSATVPPVGPLQPGAQVQTPLGTVSTSPSGDRLALDANGQQKYKESMAALRGKFAVPRVMKGMQGLPQMDLKLGVSNFDPFSGRFHGKE